MKKKRIITILLVFMLTVSMFLPSLTVGAVGNDTNYSDVLDDLKKDPNFTEADYPSSKNISTKAITLIQIAESENGELFLYTYQPLNGTVDITASKINMALGYNSESYKPYDLKCVSTNGVFNKYVVQDFSIPNYTERYYKISGIFRPWNNVLDADAEGDTVYDYKVEEVAQTWCCYQNDSGELQYAMEKLDVVEITPTLNDTIYVYAGTTIGKLFGYTRDVYGWYIAFNVENYDVDKLISAEITYKKVDYVKTVTESKYIFGALSNVTESVVYKKSDDHSVTASSPDSLWIDVPCKLVGKSTTLAGKGLFPKTYTFNEIMKAQDFISDAEDQGLDINDDTRSKLESSELVFVFATTDHSELIQRSFNDTLGYETGVTTTTGGSIIKEVTFLSLKFLSKGTVYNLGAVADITTADDNPGMTGSGSAIDDLFDNKSDGIWEQIKKVLAVVFLLLLLLVLFNLVPILSPIITTVVKLVVQGFELVIGSLWHLISLPFKKSKRKK